MWIPLAARVKARLPKQGFPRLADWPFAFKMGMLPAISIATLIATISIAASTLDQQAKLVDAVVQQNMAMIQHLSDSATRLQHVDAGLYRVLTLQAAHSAEQPVADDIAVLLSSLDSVLQDLMGYRGSLTDPDQLKRVDAMASDLQHLSWCDRGCWLDTGTRLHQRGRFDTPVRRQYPGDPVRSVRIGGRCDAGCLHAGGFIGARR